MLILFILLYFISSKSDVSELESGSVHNNYYAKYHSSIKDIHIYFLTPILFIYLSYIYRVTMLIHHYRVIVIFIFPNSDILYRANLS